MLDLKPYGAFIENTIRPLLEEFKWLLLELEKKGLKISEQSLGQIIKQVAKLHMKSLMISLMRDVIVTLIIGFVVWQVLS